MIKSMTGYGRGECATDERKITVEIRSLNSRQLDLSLRIPSIYREQEQKIRTLLTESMIRGKVDLSVSYENLKVASRINAINKELFEQYYTQLKEVAEASGIDIKNEALIGTILRMPDIMQAGSSDITEDEFKTLLSAVRLALADIERFQREEGNALIKDILSRITNIGQLLQAIKPFEGERIESVKNRILENLEKAKVKVDENRFEQELIFYLERFDITEEKVRLTQHLNYFSEVAKNEGQAGRKLNFISQEIGREVNTIGSKANHVEIQKIAVQMKDELEKIKEQMLNIL